MLRPRLIVRFAQGAFAVAGAVTVCAAPAMATPSDPSSTTSLLPSTAIFQAPTCTAAGAHSAFVTLTNGATATQTFSFTTNSGDLVTPAGMPVAPGQSRTVTVTAPARARAIFVTAGTTTVGSIALTSCTPSSSTTSSPSYTSATSLPSQSPTRSATVIPTAPTASSTTAPSTTSTRPTSSSPAPTSTTPTSAPMTVAPTTRATRAPSSSATSTSASSSSSSSASSSTTDQNVPPVMPAPTSIAASAQDKPSSTNPLYVAAGVAVGVLGLALAVVAIRREFSR